MGGDVGVGDELDPLIVVLFGWFVWFDGAALVGRAVVVAVGLKLVTTIGGVVTIENITEHDALGSVAHMI